MPVRSSISSVPRCTQVPDRSGTQTPCSPEWWNEVYSDRTSPPSWPASWRSSSGSPCSARNERTSSSTSSLAFFVLYPSSSLSSCSTESGRDSAADRSFDKWPLSCGRTVTDRSGSFFCSSRTGIEWWILWVFCYLDLGFLISCDWFCDLFDFVSPPKCQAPSWFISVDFQLYVVHFFTIQYLVQKPKFGLLLAFGQMFVMTLYSAQDIFFNDLEPYFNTINVYLWVFTEYYSVWWHLDALPGNLPKTQTSSFLP